MKRQIKFTLEQIQEAMEQNEGFCVACGASNLCCEPDARNYTCEECDDDQVFGAEEIVLMGLVKSTTKSRRAEA